MSTTPVTPPEASLPVASAPAVAWPWWAWAIPWIGLWLMEAPLLTWNWGFTLSKVGALGPLLPLGMYLGMGMVCSTAAALVGWIFRRIQKSSETETQSRWLFRCSIAIAWGALAGGLGLYSLLFSNPLQSQWQAQGATLLGAALGGMLSLLLARLIDPAPPQRIGQLALLLLVGSLVAMPSRLPVWAGSASQPNVLLLSIDTVNVRHLSTYGYDKETTPNLTRIANEGVLFENAWCHVALTGPSHGSIFSGLQPQAFHVYDNAKPLPLPLETLAELFREKGYFTLGIPGNLVMLEAYNMHQGFDRYPQRSQERGVKSLQWEHTLPWRIRRVMWNDRATTALMVHNAQSQNRHFFESLPLAGSRRWFTWLHYFDAHAPYEAPADMLLEPRELPDQDLSSLGSIPGLFNLSHVALEPLYGHCFLQHHQVNPLVASPEEIRDLIRIYDAQLRYLDQALGELFDRLRASGELDNTIIVICGDHGEALFERGYFGHSFFLHDDEMRVPLIVWYGDKLKPDRVKRPVALSDIAPTIAEMAGLRPPAAWKRHPALAGRSMVRLLNGEDDPTFETVYMARFDHARGMVTADQQKLVYQAVLGKTALAARPWNGPQWLWFDLKEDPKEELNLAGRDLTTIPDNAYQRLLRLQGPLLGLSRDIDGVPAEDINFQQYLEAAVSEQEAAMLRSLGYLQGPSSSGPQSEAACEQPVRYTPAAERWRSETGVDPRPTPMGFQTYLWPEDVPIAAAPQF